MKRFLSLAVLFLATTLAMVAQIDFKVSYNRVSSTELDVVFTGTADAGWHIYSTNIPDGGPNPAEFGLDKIEGAELVGALRPGAGAKTEYDAMFEMDITFFENNCTFTQRVKLLAENYAVKGYLNYSACNDQNCLPPTNVEFDLKGTDGPKAAAPAKEKKEAKAAAVEPAKKSETKAEAPAEVPMMELIPAQPVENAVSNWWTPVIDELQVLDGGQTDVATQSLIAIFFLGLVGGFIALVTPCVWPIIPMTVSFFLKRSSDRKKAIRDAVTYGISIIVIYLSLGYSST